MAVGLWGPRVLLHPPLWRSIGRSQHRLVFAKCRRFSSDRTMDWSCNKCTFKNTGGTICKVCESRNEKEMSAGADGSGSGGWSCPSCTFSNRFSDLFCELCDAEKPDKAPAASARLEEVPAPMPERNSTPGKRKSHEDEPGGPVLNPLLRQLHTERMSRQTVAASSSANHSVSSASSGHDVLVFMTYNVWFREDLEVEARMRAIGQLVKTHQPHVVCFQEVTPSIYEMFRRSEWWSQYISSVSPELAERRAYFCMQLSRLPVDKYYRNPFRNSVMGRELSLADLKIGTESQLVVATTHLESPCPAPPTWNQMYSPQRVAQAKESFTTLAAFRNVIFGGDMNWDDKLDGPPPLPDGWSDAWLKLRPGEAGLTYDTKGNAMLSGSRLLQKRLDRIFCYLQDFQLESIDMIGTESLPGVLYQKEKTVRKQKQLVTLPVLPSDHFGLLLKIRKT